jgi:hypothetical protein
MIDYEVDHRGWFTRLEGVTLLDHSPDTGNFFELGANPVLVWHTTETSGLVHIETPPHLEIKGKELMQFRPLKMRASALVGPDRGGGPYDPNAFAVQIEIVGFSKRVLWKPDRDTTDTLARASAAVCDFHKIPRRVPNEAWLDDCSDVPGALAAENSRRRWAKEPEGAPLRHYPAERGIWYHMEVPWQGNVHPPPPGTWHWDCGALRRREIIELVEGYMGLVEADKKVLAKWLGVNEAALEFVGESALTLKRLAVDHLAEEPTEPTKRAVFKFFREQQDRIADLEAAIEQLRGRTGTGRTTPPEGSPRGGVAPPETTTATRPRSSSASEGEEATD